MKEYFKTIADNLGLTLIYTRAQAANVVLDNLDRENLPCMIVNPLLKMEGDSLGRYILGFEVSIVDLCPLDFDEGDDIVNDKMKTCRNLLRKSLKSTFENETEQIKFRRSDLNGEMFYDKFASNFLGALKNVYLLENTTLCDE